MNRRYDDRYESDRAESGRAKTTHPERDEYGQFSGGRGGDRYRDAYEDRGSSGRGRQHSSTRYSEDEDRGYAGRSSSERYSSSRYDDEGAGDSSARGGDYSDSAGRHYSRESWERAQEGRALGGRHSHNIDNDRGYAGRSGSQASSRLDDDDDRSRYGRSDGQRSSPSRYEEDDGRSYSGRSGYGGSDDRRSSSRRHEDVGDRNYSGRGSGYTDSAGRHYTRESWERAQEGRALGGQHSHGGR